MNRWKKLMMTSAVSVIYQVTSIIYGLILPRLIIIGYGSEVNGLVSSISQFLSFITLAECGVGAVVTAAFYKPVTDKNIDSISKIFVSSDKFFKKVAYLLIGYIIVLMYIYPIIVKNTFEKSYIILFVWILSISYFAQYYFGMTYRLLLTADQLAYIIFATQTVVLILNLVASIILIDLGADILFVKLITSITFLIQPLIFGLVVHRRYNINRNIVYTEEPIKQKWNGLAQHIASIIVNNTDIAILTLFSSLINVSIYSVYNMVTSGIKQLMISIFYGVPALLGNMLSERDQNRLSKSFDLLEWVVHSATAILLGLTGNLLIPFIEVYMKDVSDANYVVPLFSYMITMANAAYCLRIPYQSMVNAAGHFKETQNGATIEAIINISISIALVYKLGLVGVAIGTFVAMTYKTIYLVIYLKHNILNRKYYFFLKNLGLDFLIVIIPCIFIKLFNEFFSLSNNIYLDWMILAIKETLVFLISFVIINAIFNRSKLVYFVQAGFIRKS